MLLLSKKNIQLVPIALFQVLYFFSSQLSYACDICSLYSAARTRDIQPGNIRFSLSQQSTSFDRGERATEGEIVKSFSTTLTSFAYDFSKRTSLEVNLPFIYRRYTHENRSGSDSGLGDSTVLLSYRPYFEKTVEKTFITSVSMGIKFPTGDTGSLDRSISQRRSSGDSVIDQDLQDEKKTSIPRHHEISGIGGGRVLVLGSGSYDFPLATNFYLQQERFLMLGGAQYTIRTEGDYDYRFSNDLSWDIGPGVFVYSDHNKTAALRAVLYGEHKWKDYKDGSIQNNTEANNLYAGAESLFSVSHYLNGYLGVYIPFYREKNIDVIPEWRMRAGIVINLF
jgi:hypothetical protein